MNYKEKLQKFAYCFGYACALGVFGSLAFTVIALFIRLGMMVLKYLV